MAPSCTLAPPCSQDQALQPHPRAWAQGSWRDMGAWHCPGPEPPGLGLQQAHLATGAPVPRTRPAPGAGGDAVLQATLAPGGRKSRLGAQPHQHGSVPLPAQAPVLHVAASQGRLRGHKAPSLGLGQGQGPAASLSREPGLGGSGVEGTWGWGPATQDGAEAPRSQPRTAHPVQGRAPAPAPGCPVAGQAARAEASLACTSLACLINIHLISAASMTTARLGSSSSLTAR